MLIRRIYCKHTHTFKCANKQLKVKNWGIVTIIVILQYKWIYLFAAGYLGIFAQ